MINGLIYKVKILIRRFYFLLIALTICLLFSASLADNRSTIAVKNPVSFVRPYKEPKTTKANAVPDSIFGGWQINKVVEVGRHNDKNAHLNQFALGKGFVLRRNRIVVDHRLTWLGWICAKPTFKMEIGQKRKKGDQNDKSLYKKGELGFYAMPNRNPSMHIRAICGKNPMFVMEVTPDNQLVNYYDGWLFFAEKIRT